jgi:hypothetical protein
MRKFAAGGWAGRCSNDPRRENRDISLSAIESHSLSRSQLGSKDKDHVVPFMYTCTAQLRPTVKLFKEGQAVPVNRDVIIQ